LGNYLQDSERDATRWRAMYLSRPVSQAVLEMNVINLRDVSLSGDHTVISPDGLGIADKSHA